jgi:glucose-6-phosphate isomerase
MSVTAAKLGQSPVMLDWSNLLSVGSADKAAFDSAWSKLRNRFETRDVGFYSTPVDEEVSQADASIRLAQECRAQGFTDVLFLGIGGSALGPISLLSSLHHLCDPAIRFHFMENPDPTDWKNAIRACTPERTLVCAVTKSGTTFETLAQFLLALEWLGKDRWKSNVIAITDPDKGDLKTFATREGIRTLHIHPSVGGRFSVFSPVGLFPAALAGLDVRRFLAGAGQVRDHMEKSPVEKNPLFILGAELIRQYRSRPIHVCMPYSTPLRQMGSWFVQLWGESLGKDGKGFTPLAAVGATDQHSILQLLRDGPDDKITLFMTVDQVDDEVTIPKTIRGMDANRLPSFAMLQGHTLAKLLMVEYRATSLVLTKRGRPHLSVKLDRLDERNIGALYFAFSILTAFTGTLWGINPFDQPGVEEGKIYIRKSLTEDPSLKPEEIDENSPVARLRREPSNSDYSNE